MDSAGTLYLSIGSNLGNRQAKIETAIRLIGEQMGRVVAASDLIETAPWGFKSDNAFLNAALKVETRLSPLEALNVAQAIERQLRRKEKSVDGQYHDRPIDIDLLLYFDPCGKPVNISTGTLTLPHPLMRQREFVMVPLRQIAPELDL